MWLLIARWQYFSSVGASLCLCQRRGRESPFLVGWRDLVADSLTDVEAVGFLFLFFSLVVFFTLAAELPQVVKGIIHFPRRHGRCGTFMLILLRGFNFRAARWDTWFVSLVARRSEAPRPLDSSVF